MHNDNGGIFRFNLGKCVSNNYALVLSRENHFFTRSRGGTIMKDDKKYDWSKEIYGEGKDGALLVLLGIMMLILLFNVAQ
jgi:hypothetical protein